MKSVTSAQYSQNQYYYIFKEFFNKLFLNCLYKKKNINNLIENRVT